MQKPSGTQPCSKGHLAHEAEDTEHLGLLGKELAAHVRVGTELIPLQWLP